MIAAREWDHRYRAGDTPWDMGRPNPLLADHLADDPALGLGGPGRALVPGCGRGWDAAVLAEAGWKVTALDVSSAAVSHTADLLEPHGGQALVADALDWVEDTDVLVDHTFFCALPTELRPRFGDLATRVVRPSGLVISIVFPIGRESTDGPPYDMTVDDVAAVLGDRFETVKVGAETRIGRRSWPHRWAVWRRTGPA